MSELQLQPLSIDWPKLIKQMLEIIIPSSDDIMDCPSKLGSLLTICAELVEIEPVVRERAATLALQKREIPGWILVHRDGYGYVDTQRIIDLCRQCPVACLEKLLTTLAMQLGNISAHKYQELCESAGLEGSPEAVRHSGATVFLRRHSKSEEDAG
jgi:hypothetical protein